MGLQCPYVTSSNKATCDKSKSYILLANYDDKTLLRDWSASALANAIPIPVPGGDSRVMIFQKAPNLPQYEQVGDLNFGERVNRYTGTIGPLLCRDFSIHRRV